MSLAAELEHIRDSDQIAEYKVKGTPALIINAQSEVFGHNAIKK